MKKVLFLFTNNKTYKQPPKSHYFGMYELNEKGFESSYIELEHFMPRKVAEWVRKILGMHFMHIPLFPLFFKYDIVFTSTAYGSLVLKSILRIKKFKWVILDFNLLGTIGDATTTKQKIFKWAVSKADGIVTISEVEKNGLLKLFPHLTGKIEFIHEAVDLDVFLDNTESNEEGDYILSVGTYGRDFKTLIEAVRGMDTKLIIATKPERMKDMDIPENVSFGFYSVDRMKELYKQAKVVVISLDIKGEYDSVGTLSIGEAMAMGKAIVVTKTKSMESYVVDGENAVFFEDKNSRDLKQKINQLLGGEEKRKYLGTKANKFATENLSLDAFSTRLASFLLLVVKR